MLMAAYSNKPQPLGEVMQALIDRMGLRKKIDEARIVEAWATLAGATINGVTDKAWVKGGRLYVRINSAATWCKRLFFVDERAIFSPKHLKIRFLRSID